MNIDEIIVKQQEFFASGKTLDIKFRKEMLKKLYNAVKKATSAKASLKDLCAKLVCRLPK